MKPITITIPESLDAEATAEAKRRGVSKSELIRQGLALLLPSAPEGEGRNPWRALAGFGSPGLSSQPGEVDDVVYGRP